MANPCIICYRPIRVNNRKILSSTAFATFFQLLEKYLTNAEDSKEKESEALPLERPIQQNGMLSCEECFNSTTAFNRFNEQIKAIERQMNAEVRKLKIALVEGLDNQTKEFPLDANNLQNRVLTQAAAEKLAISIDLINKCTWKLQGTSNEITKDIPGQFHINIMRNVTSDSDDNKDITRGHATISMGLEGNRATHQASDHGAQTAHNANAATIPIPDASSTEIYRVPAINPPTPHPPFVMENSPLTSPVDEVTSMPSTSSTNINVERDLQSPIMIPALKTPINSELSRFPANSKKNHTTGKYECKLCPKNFPRIDSFKTHYEKKHLKLIIKCVLCKAECWSDFTYNSHFGTFHMIITITPKNIAFSPKKRFKANDSTAPCPSSSKGSSPSQYGNPKDPTAALSHRGMTPQTRGATGGWLNSSHYAGREQNSARHTLLFRKKARHETVIRPNNDEAPSAEIQKIRSSSAVQPLPPISTILKFRRTATLPNNTPPTSNLYTAEAGTSSSTSSLEPLSDNHGPSVYVSKCVHCGLVFPSDLQLTEHIKSCRSKYRN